MNQELAERADLLRKKIKSLLPRAEEHDPSQTQDIYYSKDKYGNTLYDGPSLESAASGLVAAMELGKGWGWNLAIFQETRPIVNEFKQIYLVPLCANAVITPGGILKEGFFTFIANEPSLNPGAPVLFIARV